VGTSGWVYRHWKEVWYGGLPASKWLEFDADRFTGLEANGTFYRLSKPATFENWARRTPDEFRFTIKAHRFLTHLKRLSDISEGIQRQREPALQLGDKLACVVWQLPSFLVADLAKLQSFAEDTAGWPETRHAIEFRHSSWFVPEVARLMERYRLAVCISDAAGWPRWDALTTDLAYVRLHGHTHTYWNEYTAQDLEPWANRMQDWIRQNIEVHAYFDNDAQGFAPFDALKLMEMLGVSKNFGSGIAA
jgi:uncharacterized protein YecE (DUF72 family)